MKILRYLSLLLLGASLGFAQPATVPFTTDSVQLVRVNQNGQNYFPTVTLQQIQQLFVAPQSVVNAGTDNSTFVTPATLNSWAGGGGGLGSMALQNSNNVSISGGVTSGVTGSGNTEIGLTLTGSINVGNGPGFGGYFDFSPNAMAALAIDVNQMWNTKTVTNATTGHPNEV